jgi:hypothetical protein
VRSADRRPNGSDATRQGLVQAMLESVAADVSAANAADFVDANADVEEPDDGGSDPGGEDDMFDSSGNEGVEEEESERDEDDDDENERDDASTATVEWYDSENEDGSRGLLKLRVHSFREAAELLEDADGDPIIRLGFMSPADDESDPRVVRGITAALGRKEGGWSLRRVEFEGEEWGGMPEADVAHLFNVVLPSHPTIEARPSRRAVRHALSSLHQLRERQPAHEAGSPRRIHRPRQRARYCEIDSLGVKHVASLVRRLGSPLRVLTVTSPDGGLEPDDCQVLCESVPYSQSLRTLCISVKKVHAGTFAGASAPTSPLRDLYVTGPSPRRALRPLQRSSGRTDELSNWN